MLQKSINIAASGSIIAGVPGKRIRVVNFVIVAAGAVTAKFTSTAGGVDFTGAMSLITGQPISSGYAAVRGTGGGYDGHWDSTNQGDDLTLTLGAGVQVSGWINYLLVP